MQSPLVERERRMVAGTVEVSIVRHVVPFAIGPAEPAKNDVGPANGYHRVL